MLVACAGAAAAAPVLVVEEKAVAVRLLSGPVERWHVQRLMSVRQETQTLGSLPATRGDIRELEEALSHGPQAAVALGC